jgi:DNA-binding transcriptional regulator YiaG
MSVQIRKGGLAELIQPRVNGSPGETRLDFGSAKTVLYGAATAGKSGAVQIPSGPMDLYNDLTGFLGSFIPNPRARPTTGYLRVASSLGEMDPATPEALITIVGGLEGFMVLPLQAPPSVWHANVTPLGELAAARRYASQAGIAARREIQRQLDKAKAAYAQRPLAGVISELADRLGMSQLVMARALSVSPTAIRKWRRGEAARPEHRDLLASLAAFAHVLERHVHDPAGWMEIPISAQATLTPLDLFGARRSDLAVLFAAGLSDPDETLSAFAPDWRQRFEPDLDYEVVPLHDGSRSAVPRKESHR